MAIRSYVRTAVLLLSCAAVAVVGCQSRESTSRDVVGETGKKITIVENSEAVAYKETTVDAIVRIDDARGMDWLNEDEIVVGRENPDFAPEVAEGISWYPQNLYVHDIDSGSQTPIAPGNVNQGNAMLSPDRTKLFYKTFSLQANTGQGHLMDLATKKDTAFTENDEMDVQNGSWADNSLVLFATIDGTLRFAAPGNAGTKKIISTRTPFGGNNLAYLNGTIYYTTLAGELYAGKPGGEYRLLPVENVVWMVPSPDERSLAIVRRVKSGLMELDVTDLNGEAYTAIAQDAQIFGASWSPDGSRLAYAAISLKGTVRGINVADTKTGRNETLPIDAKFMSGDPLHWSPAGTRLMVTATQPDENAPRNRFVTYLVRTP